MEQHKTLQIFWPVEPVSQRSSSVRLWQTCLQHLLCKVPTTGTLVCWQRQGFPPLSGHLSIAFTSMLLFVLKPTLSFSSVFKILHYLVAKSRVFIWNGSEICFNVYWDIIYFRHKSSSLKCLQYFNKYSDWESLNIHPPLCCFYFSFHHLYVWSAHRVIYQFTLHVLYLYVLHDNGGGMSCFKCRFWGIQHWMDSRFSVSAYRVHETMYI